MKVLKNNSGGPIQKKTRLRRREKKKKPSNRNQLRERQPSCGRGWACNCPQNWRPALDSTQEAMRSKVVLKQEKIKKEKRKPNGLKGLVAAFGQRQKKLGTGMAHEKKTSQENLEKTADKRPCASTIVERD